jgi:hypothetical protein
MCIFHIFESHGLPFPNNTCVHVRSYIILMIHLLVTVPLLQVSKNYLCRVGNAVIGYFLLVILELYFSGMCACICNTTTHTNTFSSWEGLGITDYNQSIKRRKFIFQCVI